MVAERAGPSLGDRFALATVLLIGAAFVLNNLAPYLGLNYAGAMTMFSGITVTADNHLFIPKVALGGEGAYVSITDRKAQNLTRPMTETIDRLLRSGNERPQVSINVLRYHLSRACASSPGASLSLTLVTEAGQRREHENVCAEPSMLRYDVLTSRRPCNNRACTRAMRVLRAENVSWADEAGWVDEGRPDDLPPR